MDNWAPKGEVRLQEWTLINETVSLKGFLLSATHSNIAKDERFPGAVKEENPAQQHHGRSNIHTLLQDGHDENCTPSPSNPALRAVCLLLLYYNSKLPFLGGDACRKLQGRFGLDRAGRSSINSEWIISRPSEGWDVPIV